MATDISGHKYPSASIWTQGLDANTGSNSAARFLIERVYRLHQRTRRSDQNPRSHINVEN